MNEQKSVKETVEEFGLKAMSKEDANAYIDDIAKSKGKGLQGIEAMAEKMMRTLAMEVAANFQRQQAMEKENKKLNEENRQKGGMMDAYASILVKAEDERRAAKLVQTENELTADAIDGWKPPTDIVALHSKFPGTNKE